MADNPKLNLLAKTTVGLNRPLKLFSKTGSAPIPLNLNGRQFRAAAFQLSGSNKVKICDIDIIIQNAEAGVIVAYISPDVAKNIIPGDYKYEVLMKTGTADPQFMWSAILKVERGLAEWPIP